MKFDLTFNIIFTPGTVRYLQLSVLTLLHHSPYRYRLVANGLPGDERELLQRFSECSPRLICFIYPSTSALPHGSMLNILLQREASTHFCFMDSDIFASGTFDRELERHLRDCDVFSSCPPMVQDPAQILPGFTGMSVQTPAGVPLATTYFCIYRKEPIQRVSLRTSVGFEVYHPPEYLPPCAAGDGITDDLRNVHRLDTGKLLNILAASDQLRFCHKPLDNLAHVGGLSRFLRLSWPAHLRSILRRPYVLRDRNLELDVKRRQRHRSAAHANIVDASAADQYLKTRAIRKRVALYFGHLLRHLIDNGPEPVIAMTDPRLSARIERVRHAIKRIRGNTKHLTG